MLVYASLHVLDDNLHPVYARTLSHSAIPARKRLISFQASNVLDAKSAVLYARPQGRFAKIVL